MDSDAEEDDATTTTTRALPLPLFSFAISTPRPRDDAVASLRSREEEDPGRTREAPREARREVHAVARDADIACAAMTVRGECGGADSTHPS